MRYAFVLGKHRELSIAELGSFLKEKIEKSMFTDIVFFEGNLPDEPQKFLNRLGGSIQIIEIFKSKISIAEVQTVIENFLKEKWQRKTGKLKFGINFLPQHKKSQFLKKLIVETKKNLRGEGLHANFMNKNFQNVSDVFAVKSGLLNEETNINIIDEGDGRCSLGISVAIQDFEAYSLRDFGKPFRDPQVGMLPPKLAQIMINLGIGILPHSTYNIPHTIVDPFCGTGTVLMEALLMGYPVIGSDSEERMAEGCKKNIEWLQKKFIINKNAAVNIFSGTAVSLTSEIFSAKTSSTKPDAFAVVTEPHLGPPLSQFPHEKFLQRVMNELGELFTAFFKNLARLIPSQTPVVFIFPYWKKSDQEKLGRQKSVMLSGKIIGEIEALGFKKTSFPPLKATSLLYDRPDQIVGREIIRFIYEKHYNPHQ